MRLDTAAALAVGVDPAEYPGGEVAVRIDPLAAGLLEDAGQHVGAGPPCAFGAAFSATTLFRSLICVPDLGGLAAGEHGVAGVGFVRSFSASSAASLPRIGREQRGGLLRGVGGLALPCA